MGYKTDWTDREILAYALKELTERTHEMEMFLENNRVAMKKYKVYCELISLKGVLKVDLDSETEELSKLIKKKFLKSSCVITNALLYCLYWYE